MTVVRTAREVVELYNLAVWNEQDYSLAEEIIGESITRHGAGTVKVLTHAEAVQRVRETWAGVAKIWFDLNIVVADTDSEHVAIVYECSLTAHDGTETVIGSIEIFRVVDGHIIEVWNGSGQGRWQ